MISSDAIAKYALALLLLSYTAESKSSSLRGNDDNSPIAVIVRRSVAQNDTVVLCRVATFDTMFYDEMENQTSTQEQPTCLPIIDDIESDYEFPITLPENIMEQYSHEIEMGTLLIEISDARIDEVDEQLIVGLESHYTVVNTTKHNRHLIERHLQIKPTMTVAVIRVSTTDASPSLTSAQLRSSLFNPSGTNFVTQYNAISFGKLKWTLAPAGAFDVRLPSPLSSYGYNSGSIVTAVQKQVKAQYQISEVAALADKVIMCLPPGTGNWAASAAINHWRAQFNHNWCTSLSGTMHELGHTMGLLHAQANGVEYADRTGYMGSGYTSSTYPKKGFDGYNSWYFKWYSDRHLRINPKLDGSKLVKLASFVDYKKAATDESVVININDQYFLVYNTNKGFNIDTEQRQNQVTVTERKTTGTNNLAGLNASGKFTVANYQGTGKSLLIHVCKAMTGRNGASVMQVSIGLGSSICGTTQTTAGNRSNEQPTTGSSTTTTGSNTRSAFLKWLDTILHGK